jgi:tRNA modification GTPase
LGPKLRRDGGYLIQTGQKIALEEIRDGLRSAARSLSEGYRPELLAEELRTAVAGIGRLTARISPDEVISSVFARFCLGK